MLKWEKEYYSLRRLSSFCACVLLHYGFSFFTFQSNNFTSTSFWKANKMKTFCCISNGICRPLVPEFGRSVNPISTRVDRLCPRNYYWHTRIFRPSDGPAMDLKRVSFELAKNTSKTTHCLPKTFLCFWMNELCIYCYLCTWLVVGMKYSNFWRGTFILTVFL